MLQLRPREQYAIGVLVIVIAAIVVYFGVIFPRDADRIYPWSSDAWGHLVKADYLRQQLGDGELYPDLFPSWYSGQQLFRYFPPLSYYVLVGLNEVTGNIFTAGNLFIFLTALLGGLSFLLFAPRTGFFWAIVAGILFIIFPDNVRVAFAEGNMPRLMAASLLPAAFFFLLNLIENPRSKRNFAGLFVVIGLIVLSHAMMAGIFLAGLGFYTVTYWLIKGGKANIVITGAVGLFSGLLVSGWWMLPSLTGGLAELDNTEGSEAIAEFAPSVALNPGLRSSDSEIFYVGLSMVILLFAAMFLWKRLEPWMQAMVVVTFVMGLIGTTFIIDIWRAVPLNELFWARRFMTFAALGFVLTAVSVARLAYRAGYAPERRWLRIASMVILIGVLIDFQPSIELIRSRERPEPVQEIAEELAVLDGWKVATVDLSRLGSAPSMLFTTEGKREQIFGWAFQGAITARLLARINQSITENHLDYAVSRLDRLGTDDVVIMPRPDISPNLGDALEADGYNLVTNSGDLLLYHRDGQPRAFTVPMNVLGIGTGAESAGLLFPSMTIGSSSNIDDYSDEFIQQFDVVLLSRFETASRGNAEERVRGLAEGGVTFIVDMTGAPSSPLSRQPKFLDVHGEPVLQIERAVLVENGQRTMLEFFDDSEGPWRSVTPQGADETLVTFEYPAAEGAALSRNRYGDGEVYFVGLNLFFHGVVTRDAAAISMLEDLIGIPAFEQPDDIAYPLRNYETGQDGWTFDIDLPDAGWVLFPMAHYDGTKVFANGQQLETIGIERLTFARMPAGVSSVEIRSERTGIYTAGYIASLLGLLLFGGFMAGFNTRTGSRLLNRAKGIFDRQRGQSGQGGQTAGSGDEPVKQA